MSYVLVLKERHFGFFTLLSVTILAVDIIPSFLCFHVDMLFCV